MRDKKDKDRTSPEVGRDCSRCADSPGGGMSNGLGLEPWQMMTAAREGGNGRDALLGPGTGWGRKCATECCRGRARSTCRAGTWHCLPWSQEIMRNMKERERERCNHNTRVKVIINLDAQEK